MFPLLFAASFLHTFYKSLQFGLAVNYFILPLCLTQSAATVMYSVSAIKKT